MYIETVPNRGSRPAILLREGKREGKRVVKRTLANLSDWPEAKIEALRQVLRGGAASVDKLAIEASVPHGHVEAVLGLMRALGMDNLLASRPCRQRDLVLAMLAQRLLDPCSKLAATRLWATTTLAGELGVEEADVNELYAALDWLLARQNHIENKLAKRHLEDGAVVLFDVSSSSYHGRTCPLARYGYNRDGEKLPSIVYGLMTDSEGRPVAVDVYPGNTGDPSTVPDQVDKLRERFGLSRVVLVGDRGMLTQTRLESLRAYPDLGWISALRFTAIRDLAEQGAFQPSLFDACNLAEITSEHYPGERLVACRNDALAKLRAHKRESLLQATEALLQEIAARIKAGKLTGQDKIGVQVGKIINRHRVAKHFDLDIGEATLGWTRRQEAIDAEAALDGLYVIRTSLAEQRMDAAACVRSYKSLSGVERAFRSLKTVDLKVRPIHHRLESRVRAHILLCMLAYYVEWHMRQAWAPLMFADTEQQAKATRDPVAPAERSPSAKRKAQTRVLDDGEPVHSFATLLAEMATLVRNTCRASGTGTSAPTFEVLTTPSAHQQRALALIQAIRL